MTASMVDVVVAGGGPAGLSAGIRLAKAGVRVLLCEAQHYPHDKMCGEFLSPESPGLLRELGMTDAYNQLRPAAINEVRVTAPDGSCWQEALPGTAWGASRRNFDAALADHARHAGVQVCEGTTVESVKGNLERGFKVQLSGQLDGEVPARVVIGAQGKRSKLDRALRRKFFAVRQPYLALKAHFEGPAVPGRIELHGFPGGYCGISEIEDGRMVACLLVHERVFRLAGAGPGSQMENFITWMQRQNPGLQEWFRVARRLHPRWISISQVCFAPKPALEQDLLMAGDAAGLIAPLAGNGISMALQGGIIAGGLAAQFLNGTISTVELRARYPAALRRSFGQRLALGRILQPLMLRPSTLRLALRLLNGAPPLGAFLITHTRARSTT